MEGRDRQRERWGVEIEAGGREMGREESREIKRVRWSWRGREYRWLIIFSYCFKIFSL